MAGFDIRKNVQMKERTLHLRAPGNWINDPNGFIWYKGKYHLFYQYFPYAPEWGTMHWGHAVSENLVDWEHLGIAVFPSKKFDRNGVFSGSAIEKDGEMMLYYTAVQYLETDDEDIHRAKPEMFMSSQALITSKDGIHFDNWKDKRQIIPTLYTMENGGDIHARDPKVWETRDGYGMVIGSMTDKREGRLLFYRSKDGKEWKYISQSVLSGFGSGIECPDILSVDNQMLLLGAAMGWKQDGCRYSDQAVYAKINFDSETCKVKVLGNSELLDYGTDLYAPQTCVDKQGRRVMIAWMRMPGAVKRAGEILWNGMMCLPRWIHIKNDKVYFSVHPEVEECFGKAREWKGEKLCSSCRIRISLSEGESLDIGGYQIRCANGCLETDRSLVFANWKNYRLTASTPKLQNECRLDIYVDRDIIEIFVNEGEYALSHIVYGLGDYLNCQCSDKIIIQNRR